MPVPARRRTRNKSDDLIPTQADTSKGPTPKKPRTKRTESDPDKENVLKDDNLLVETVTKAGFILKTGKEPNILTKDQAVFLKAAHKDITTHIQYPENVQEMMTTLEEYLEDREFLRKCLTPTVTSSNCDSARSSSQECFLRLLLNLPDLQPKLLKLLLEKLAEISLDDDSPPPTVGSQQVNIPRLILSAVRWLDKIVNGSELADHVMMILDATNTDVQMEIITAVPEIVDDAHHSKIAMGLRGLYGASGKQELTATLLDAFTNLNLNTDLLSDLRGTVMKTVRSVHLPDLPTVVKFILGVIPSGEASTVIQELRDNLDLTPPNTQRPGPSSPKKKMLQARKNVECIVLDAIKMSAAMEKTVADAWIKAVESVKEDHKPEDILVTLLLHEMPNKKKLIESLTRNKVRNGLYTEDLIKETFNLHPTALKQHFNAIIALAEEMLQSSEPTVSQFGLVLYTEAFVHLDGYYRQEVVGDLVSKVGYGGGGPLTAGALGVLDHLAAEHPDKLSDYALFVSAVLEYLDSMTLSQVRQIMGILASLAWRPGQGENVGGVVQDDLHIVIRKQLDSGNSVYKRMGVVGAVTAVKAMGMVGEEEIVPSSHVSQDTSGNSSSHMPQASLRNAKMLLDMVKAKTRTSQEAAGLFLDELAYTVSCGKINTKLMEWVSTKITDDFTNDYVADMEGPNEQQCQSLSVTYQLVLDEQDGEASDEDSPITLNLAPIVIKSLHLPGKEGEASATIRPDQLAAPARLIPLFRLLYCATAAMGKGDLEDIDALLGCGIWLPSEERPIDAMTVLEKNAVCACLFYAINWCREIVNAFATQEDVDLKNKVLMRLKHILQLQETLQVSLKHNPNFVPPAAQFLQETTAWNPPATVEKGKAKGGKGKGRGKKGKPAPMDGDATVNLNTQGTQGATPGPPASLPHNQTAANITTKIKQVASIDLAHYRPFFREMDLNVLQILRYGNLCVESSPDLIEEMKEPKLRPPEFEFILQDLILKMEHSLISTTSKKRGFPGKGNNLHTIGYSNLDRIPPKQIASQVAQHLQPLFQHIDEIVQYFQRMVSMNDGDTGGLLMDQGPLLCRCLSLSFRVARSLFSWTGFQAAESRSSLMEALVQLVSRVEAFDTADSTVPRLVESCIKYLNKFTDAIVDIEVAGHHLLLIEALHKLSGKSATARYLAKVSEEYLKRDWTDPEGNKSKGAEFNSHVEKIITVYLQYSQDCVEAVDGLCVDGIINLIEKTKKDSASDEFPTITKGTASFFYKSMLTTLVNKVRGITYGVTKDPDEQLEVWCRTIASLHRCILLLKTWSNRQMLSAVLKLSRQFLDHFFRHGMPLLDKVFRRKRDDCTSLLKNLQLSTRFLQHVCSHSKIMKDVSLSNNVPLLKKSLEVFVYRVKAMLAANNCIEIFWMGNLKNRDLQGEEILSQASRVEDDDEESEGEEDLPEEDESDVEVGDDSSEKNDDRDDGDSAISIEI